MGAFKHLLVLTVVVITLSEASRQGKNNGEAVEKFDPIYESSDPNLPWPPSQDSDAKTWPGSNTSYSMLLYRYKKWIIMKLPGQGDRFGKHWPRTRVQVLSTPPSYADFESDFLLKDRPVVVEGLLAQMTKKSGIDLQKEDWITSGRAAISNVLAQFTSKVGIKWARTLLLVIIMWV